MLSQIILCRSLCLWYKIEAVALRIGQTISLLAHNSQNYQNQMSLELGIVVKRVALAFVVLFLLCCCRSPLVQQGSCPLAYSIVVKVCYKTTAHNQDEKIFHVF